MGFSWQEQQLRLHGYILPRAAEIWAHYRQDPRVLLTLTIHKDRTSALEPMTLPQRERWNIPLRGILRGGGWPLLVVDPCSNAWVADVNTFALSAEVQARGLVAFPSEQGHTWRQAGQARGVDGHWRDVFACVCKVELAVPTGRTVGSVLLGESAPDALAPQFRKGRLRSTSEPPCAQRATAHLTGAHP